MVSVDCKRFSGCQQKRGNGVNAAVSARRRSQRGKIKPVIDARNLYLRIAGNTAAVSRGIGEHHLNHQRLSVRRDGVEIGVARRRVDGIGNGKFRICNGDGDRSHGDHKV